MILLDADLGDEAQGHRRGPHRRGPHIGFLEAFAQILGGDEAGFAVGQVAPGFISKFHECGVRQADDMAWPSTKNLCQSCPNGAWQCRSTCGRSGIDKFRRLIWK